MATHEKTPREWLATIRAGHAMEEDWRKKVAKIMDIYGARKGTDPDKVDYNILHANTQVLFAAVYSNAPRPDVRRRFRDKDPIARAVSEVIERCLSYSIDSMPWDDMMRYCRLDYLLSGRSVIRIRYEPLFKQIEPKPEEVDDRQDEADLLEVEVAHQTVTAEAWPIQDFARSACYRWEKTEWIAFRHWMPKRDAEHEFETEFPMGAKVKDHGHRVPKDAAKEEENSIELWELWHKPTKKLYWISEEDTSKFLREKDDPLRLKGFFPIPPPLYSIPQTDTLIPKPEYELYEDLAFELQILCDRMNKLQKSVRVRGLYDATIKEFGELFDAVDTKMLAAISATKIRQGGGLSDSVWMYDNRPAVDALVALKPYRDGLIQAIYEITGISDIVRGSTDAGETATAQNLKARYGSLRIEPRQNAVSYFLRDLLRLWSEIICEHFNKETLMQMTGLELPDEAMWDEIIDVMRNEVQVSYRIDIETDSTIADLTLADQNMLNELLGAISQFVATMQPLVLSGAVPPQVAQALLMSVVRRAKLGVQVEDAIDQLGGANTFEESLGGGAGGAIPGQIPSLPGQPLALPPPIDGGAGVSAAMGPTVSPDGQAPASPPLDETMVAAYADVMRVAAQLSEIGQQAAQSVGMVGEMVQGVAESPVMAQIAALAQGMASMAEVLTQAIDASGRQSAQVCAESVMAVRELSQVIREMAAMPLDVTYDGEDRIIRAQKTVPYYGGMVQ